MTRAEEVALKIYPKEEIKVYTTFGMFEVAIHAAERKGFQKGYEQAEKDLGWHSVEESLPPVDEEVIVLTDDINGKIVPDAHRICYGHIVDKNIAIDYDGWNIPGVKYWMYMPKLKEEKDV